MRLASLSVLALALVGCDGGSGADAGPRPGEDAGPSTEMCGVPWTECRDGEDPYPGAPCEGDFMCDSLGTTVPTTFICGGDGRFFEGCAGCMPILSERCASPSGLGAAHTLQIGPSGNDAFTEWSPDERISAVIGAQGLAMIGLRVRVAGDDPPSCLTVSVRADLEGAPGAGADQLVRLHCGDSYTVFAILPALPCELRDFPAELRVSVDGADPVVLPLIIEGEMCNLPG